MSPTWGLLDTVDNVWMGGDVGPTTYEDEVLARLAAEVLNTSLGYPAGLRHGRIQHAPFDCPEPRKRDDVDLIYTVESALNFLESDTSSRSLLRKVKPATPTGKDQSQ